MMTGICFCVRMKSGTGKPFLGLIVVTDFMYPLSVWHAET